MLMLVGVRTLEGRGETAHETRASYVNTTRSRNITSLNSCAIKLPPLPSHTDRAYPSANSSSPSNSNPQIVDKGRPTFGVDLAEQMARDSVEVPPIMEKCCQAIEKYGLQSQGIYRLSGMTSKVAKLRERLDKGQVAPLNYQVVLSFLILCRSGFR